MLSWKCLTLQVQSWHNSAYQQYGGLVTFLRLCPGLSKVLTVIYVEKLDVPACAPISGLSLLSY